MIGTGNEYYAGKEFDTIVASNSELQSLLSRVVEIIALHHPHHISNDPKVALSEVLQKYSIQLKSIIKTYARQKVFDATNKLFPSIDTDDLDNSFLLDILLKLEEFLNINRKNGTCAISHNTACCSTCNHGSLACKKCISGGGTPTKKCVHECQGCKKSNKQCQQLKTLCCSRCNICIRCNEELSQAYISSSMCLTVSTKPPPCHFYHLVYCLHICLKWRNLEAHTTQPIIDKFINKGQPLANFQMCADIKQLFSYIETAINYIMDYVSNSNLYANPLSETQHQEFKNNFRCIFENGESFQKYKQRNYERSLKRLHWATEVKLRYVTNEEKNGE